MRGRKERDGAARRFPSHATVVAYLALFAALGGTSYAAIVVTGKQVKDGTLTGRDVKNRSLRAVDFAKGQLPSGERGAVGPQGPRGLQGEPGVQGTPGSPGAGGTALAYAYVGADGGVDESRSKGIGDANVVKGLGSGTYCLVGLGFTPRNVLATPETATTTPGPKRIAQTALPPNATADTPCGFGGASGWQAAVTVFDDGTNADHPFFVMLN